jgi:hypothetical protein
MPSRDDLKALIDQLPETRMEAVRRLLERHINRPTQNPQVEHSQRRVHEYRQQVLRQFEATRKPGTLGTGGGGGIFGIHEGRGFGSQSFHYWDDQALVFQSLLALDGQTVEFMERLSFSSDGTAFLCSLEVASGGHTVRHEDQFPIAKEKEQ